MTGSNWSIRRIISNNISILANINYEVSSPRLVKGIIKITDQTVTPRQQQFEADQFSKLFKLCYENAQLLRMIREKVGKMLKGMCVNNSWNQQTPHEVAALSRFQNWQLQIIARSRHCKTAWSARETNMVKINKKKVVWRKIKKKKKKKKKKNMKKKRKKLQFQQNNQRKQRRFHKLWQWEQFSLT